MSSAYVRNSGLARWYGLSSIYFKERVQFRFDFFMSFVSTLLYSLMYYMVWKAVFANSTNFPMPWAELITYVMVGQAVNMARFSPAERRPISTMGARIQSGDIALDMLRPIGFQAQRFIESFAYFLTENMWINIPLLLLFVFGLGIAPPATFGQGMLFAVSMLFAFLVSFGLNVIILTLSFWTRNVFGPQLAKRAVVDIFAGTMIPFQLFPDWLRIIVEYLPFQGIAYIPISIWTGRLSGMLAVQALAQQLMWAAILYGIALLIWRRAMRIIVIQGG